LFLPFRYKGYYFKLGDDIAYNPWVSIGTKANPFNGNFEGNGKIISGISADQNLSYQGLFGYIGSNGTVKNVRVIADIKGKDYVGGIAGYNEGEISNVYFDGSVSGANYVGGIAGENAKNISSSYSNGNVGGANYVGGFAGKNSGSIRVAYSAGTVTGTGNVGGFVGSNCEGCRIIGGYYDKTINSSLGDPRGEGKATDEMKSEGFIKELNNAAALFSMKKWIVSEDDYPTLGDVASTYNITNYFSENGTEGEPYLIGTPKQLEYVSLLMEFKSLNFNGKYFKLDSDIPLNPSINFTPIGTLANKFQGIFDGDGKTISGIYVNSNADYIGLFGYVSSGTLKNLTITDSYIKGTNIAGGLAGAINGDVENCSFSGTVTGENNVGGLIGYLPNGKISNSYSAGTVSGTNGLGGLLGGANTMSGETTIENSYSTSTVTGNAEVGGLVGLTARTTINNSYSTGTVTGNSSVGGLVGGDGSPIERQISNSYSTGTVTGKVNVGGLIGHLSTTKINNSYSTGAVNGDDVVGGLLGLWQGTPITNNYSAGLVTKTSKTDKFGGLIGWNSKNTPISNNNYYDNTINSGFEDEQGKSTTELKTKDSPIYADWDFTTLWNIDEAEQNKANNGYPYHHWAEHILKCTADNSKAWEGNIPNGHCRDKTPEELCTDAGSTWTGGVCKTPAQLCKDAGKIWEDERCKQQGTFVEHNDIHETYLPTLTLGHLSKHLSPNHTWVDDVNTKLTAGTHHHKAKYTHESGNYTSIEGHITIHIAKAVGAKINAPTATKTHSSITVSAVANLENTEQIVEYALTPVPVAKIAAKIAIAEPTEWQTGLEFTNLTPSTDYYIFARAKESPNYNAGEISDALIKTEQAPTLPPPDISASLPQIALNNIRAQSIGNSIVLENLPANAKVELYDLQGKQIFTSGKSVNRANRGSDKMHIQVQTKGIYIIKINHQTLRIAVM